MVKDAKIDSFFKRKRIYCEANEEPRNATPQTSVPEPELATIEETSVQPTLLLLEFGQRQEEGQQTHTNDVIFCGIEFLERDPGLRPQIWQYPPNQRDDVREHIYN